MNQPSIDRDVTTGDTDTTGRKWAQALVDPQGRILAGYDEGGTFCCFVDSETLFASAMLTLQSILGSSS